MTHLLSYRLPVSEAYRKPIFDAITLQGVIGILSLMILDGGIIAQICGIALVGFWGGVAMLICRRPKLPTPADVTLIRFGYLPLVLASPFLVGFIWQLRGVG